MQEYLRGGEEDPPAKQGTTEQQAVPGAPWQPLRGGAWPYSKAEARGRRAGGGP